MPVTVGGPSFEDFHRGQVFAGAPGLTVTAAHAALHQAVAGDRLRLALDAALCRAVTGSERLLVHPNLVCDVAIGHSSEATHRVRANLFYRGLVLARPVFVGDTLRTRTEVVALRQNRSRPSGLAVLRIETADAAGEPVLGFWRCPMVPLRDPEAQTGHADDLGAIPRALDPAAVAAAIPRDWDLAPLRAAAPGPHHADLEAGTTYAIEGGETVTGAPELARATLNLAMVHTDATAAEDGRRLVFGGHTISIAAAHATRAIPALATILAWESCDHLAPVHEGDLLRTELTVEDTADDGTARLRAVVSADSGPVLDWRFVALVA